MEDTKARFSVLLPTYGGDDPGELEAALESCLDQTVPPDELLIVGDGPLTDGLEAILSAFERRYPDIVRRHSLQKNTGLGNALRVGVRECRNLIVARSDADDINHRTRFERQLTFLTEHPDVDIVGSSIVEFDDDPEQPVAVREVPTDHADIQRMARFRSPMNHGSVMFRREAVLDAGNYRDVIRMEDYDLWVRLLCEGATFANLPERLVSVRAGSRMTSRRGGLEYARAEIRRQIEFYRRDFTSLPVFIFNILTRTSIRLLPNRVRGYLYRRFARRVPDR